MELVNAACNFEPHDSFFSLFSDPRSTRLTRIHLREDLVQDQDLEAIRKQVRPASPGTTDGCRRPALRWSNIEPGAGATHLQGENPRAPLMLFPLCRALPELTCSQGQAWGRDRAVLMAAVSTRTWWSYT